VDPSAAVKYGQAWQEVAMRGLLGVLLLASPLAACGSQGAAPSDRDALAALREAQYAGALGQELNRYAFVGARVLNCEAGKRGDQPVGICDICTVVVASQAPQQGPAALGAPAAGQQLVAMQWVLRATLSRALSFENPDVVPESDRGGVWVLSRTPVLSPDYEQAVMGGVRPLPQEVTRKVGYPERFADAEGPTRLIDQLETGEASRDVGKAAGKCAAPKRSKPAA
jgi:hypothetical protein